MFKGQPFKEELSLRLTAIRRLLDATHSSIADESEDSSSTDASRDARGLAILLMFACYENLITSICRRLLEIAQTLRVGNRRLRRGFQLFAIHNQLQSLSNVSERKIWQETGIRLLDTVLDSRSCSINPDLFPVDGSFMRRSQIELLFQLFELGDPGVILKEVWGRLDTIVAERNQIAHGNLTSEEVGRRYSIAEINHLINLWEQRWCDFIDHIESSAQTRNFFRI